MFRVCASLCLKVKAASMDLYNVVMKKKVKGRNAAESRLHSCILSFIDNCFLLSFHLSFHKINGMCNSVC